MNRDGYMLFSEGRIGAMTVKNRLVRSATQGDYACFQNGRMDELLGLYRNLARGGVGLIISGGSPVFSGKQFTLLDIVFESYARIAEEVHRAAPDCRFVVQMSCPGRTSGIGPSDVPTPFMKGGVTPLSVDEIGRITDAWAEAILRLKDGGTDGVQIHGAHGHGLEHSFLSPYTNRRTDAYGGGAENRARIIGEIVSKARGRAGDFPILIKMNCTDHLEGGMDRDAFPEMAAAVGRTGVDAIEVSGGTMDCLVRSEENLGFPPVPVSEARTHIHSPEKQSYYASYLEGVRLGVPVISVGGHRDVERLEAIVRRGTADFIALCRPLIREPGLPERWREGRGGSGVDCISCNSCLLPCLFEGRPVYCLFRDDKEKYKSAQRALASWVADNVVRSR